MKENDKKAICKALKRYVAKYPSQNKAAASFNGTSAGTVSTILSGAWDKISDEMWRKIAAQVHAFVDSGEWKTVETAALQEMVYAMEDAQQWKNVTWVVGEAGCGKTTAARLYEEEHREVFYILCSEDMRRSDFVRTIALKVGIRTDGMSIRDMLDAVTGSLVQMDAPLLLFDEADKLI